MRAFAPMIGVLTVAALLVPLALPATAFADARYVKSAPAPGSTVPATIQGVTVVYSERLNPQGSSLAVFGLDGTRADQGESHVDPTRQTMQVSLKPGLRPGKYTVRWTTVSAEDGRKLSDSFIFTITHFVRSTPAPGSNLKGAPSTVSAVYDQRLNPQGSSITVTRDDGARADQGDTRIDPADPDGKTMRVSLKPDLRPDKYFVRWTAVLAEGGGEVSDSFGFTVLPWQAAPVPAPRFGPAAAVRPGSLPRAGGLPIATPIIAGLTLFGGGLALRRSVIAGSWEG